MKGFVKWFNAKKGYGFVTDTSGKEYFVHYSGINSDGYKTLDNDQKVTFDLENGKKGIQAVNVTPYTEK